MPAPQLRLSNAAGTQKHQVNPSGEWGTETGLPMGTQMRGDQHEALLYRLLVRDLQEYAIFQIDLDHKMASWNAGVERSLGYTEQEFLGLPFAQLFTEEDIAAKIPEQEIELAIKDGRSEDERWHVRKDRSIFFVYGAVVPLYKDDLLVGFSKVMRDRTEQHKAQEALKLLNEELANFSAVVSHDLRTPLRTIRTFTQLLAKELGDRLDEKNREYVAHILAGTESMSNLIDALLAYARAGGEQLPVERVAVAATVNSVWESLLCLVEKNSARLHFEGDPCVVKANGTLLWQVFQNLIENGLKYRSTEPPIITVQTKRRAREWVISVKDNGLGFDPDKRLQIFEPLKRLQANNEEGIGMGLAICKKIVHRMGGRIWADSRLGQGSIFSFTLPF